MRRLYVGQYRLIQEVRGGIGAAEGMGAGGVRVDGEVKFRRTLSHIFILRRHYPIIFSPNSYTSAIFSLQPPSEDLKCNSLNYLGQFNYFLSECGY